MSKIADYNTLKNLSFKYNHLIETRFIKKDISDLSCTDTRHILVCGGPGCKAYHSDNIIKRFQDELDQKGLSKNVKIVMTGCFGFCSQGPVINILPDNIFYVKVSEEDVDDIIESHIIKGNVVERLLYEQPETKEKIQNKEDIPFYKKQIKIALRNCGLINPESIEEAIGTGAYNSLGKVLTSMSQKDTIEEIKKSGLKGRGGGGFPTGVKWEATYTAEGNLKYVICNADEGDPGAFMDRAILEGDPHSVLEAMTICAYAIGSTKGIIYIRAEYPLAIHRLEIAIEQSRKLGLLGENILGSNFSFDIELKYGAGAFVCGEATALLRSTEGSRGEPTVKPPRTSERGLFQRPTCVNNVETFASVPFIIEKGANFYSNIGSENSKGTKVFALAGKINNVGLVEVPMGITLREIIYEIGGGIRDNKKLKAVQTGGPSGGCIPKELIDIKIDYDTLTSIGTMIGSGGMIVIDEDNCMVDIAKFYLDFSVDESCGKCTPCRIGTKRLLELLQKVTDGFATCEDLEKIKNLSEIIKDTSLCGLGQAAPNPVLSTLKYFKDEYKAHIIDKRCPSLVCKKLINYKITDKCIGCSKCVKNCPKGCINGTLKEKHNIINEKCIKCGTCFNICPIKAITKL